MVEGIRRGINAFGVAECRWLPESFLEAFRALNVVSNQAESLVPLKWQVLVDSHGGGVVETWSKFVGNYCG